MSDKDWERFKNAGLGFGPLTDEEVESMGPAMVVIVLIIAIIVLIGYISGCF